MRPNLPIVSFIGYSGGKVLGSLSKLYIKDCYSSGVITNFVLGTGVFGGGVGKQTDISVETLMGGRAISLSSLRNLSLEMFLERGIHPSMNIQIVQIIDEDGVGGICFRNIYI